MASSESFLSSGWYSSSKGDYVYLEFAWSVTNTSIENNQKTIYWELRGKRTASGYTMAGGFKVILDGETLYSKGTDYRIELRNGTIVASGSKTLTHNPDGTRSFSVYIEGGINTYAVNCTGSEDFILDTIPRASKITSAADVTLGNNCSVTWTPLSTSFYYALKFSLGDWEVTTGKIYPGVTSSYTYSNRQIPMVVAEQMPNSHTEKMTVTLFTYSSSKATTPVGSDDETFTVTVPKTEAPVVYMTLSPVSSISATHATDFGGLYIQGLSKVRAVIGADPKHMASIEYYTMTIDNETYGAEHNYTSGYLTKDGTFEVVGEAVDSRWYGGYTKASITVLPYANPKIQNVTAKRCDADGNIRDDGTYLKITATRSYYPVVSNGVQKNFCEIQYRYKAESDSYYSEWETILNADDLSSNSVDTPALLDGTLLTTVSYRVEVRAVDYIGNASPSTPIIVPTDAVYWHRDGARNALGLGKYNEQDNALDSAWDLYMNGHKVTGLADPVADTDAVTLNFLKQFSVNQYTTTDGANVLGKAGDACLGSNSNAGLLLMVNMDAPGNYALCYYHYVLNVNTTVKKIGSNGLDYVFNTYGTVSATGVTNCKFIVLPLFAID